MSEGFKGLRLYNTLTRTKEDFVPIDPANVRMYVCGPTVYDYAHIGNARPAIVFDVLYRLLRHLAKEGVWDGGKGETQVTYVRNITDVDDKINARALRDYGADIASGKLTLNEAIRKVTEPTYEQYQKDVTALGCLPPTVQPRATEHIDGMIRMAQDLIDRGHAYLAQGGEGREVLFDVASMPDYGRLSNRRLEDQQAGARVEVKDHKKNPGDFVLWKESSKSEPGWPAHFHAGGGHTDIFGRPGWHLECSVMSEAFLGREFDIHGGGLDLIFPHHENEIAQSRCAHGTDVMAKVWMHNGFLQVEGRKMSKSDGNFVTIHELEQDWTGPVLRLVMLLTNYAQPIDWTVAKMMAARDELANWTACVFDGALLGKFESDVLTHARGRIDPRVIDPLLDDLNTVEAISGLRALYSEALKKDEARYELLNAAHFLGLMPLRKIGALMAHSSSGSAPIAKFSEHRHLYLKVQAASANAVPEIVSAANAQVAEQGIKFNIGQSDGFVTLDRNTIDSTAEDATQATIDRRLAFIAAKNWAEADRIRDELLAQGIQLKDGKDPATGERITTWEVKR
jgi:cysteinyl-tRNA synthetase